MEANITGAILALIARFLSGASVRWIDSQPDRCQRVYFANHTSHLDALVIWSSLPSSGSGVDAAGRREGLLDGRSRAAVPCRAGCFGRC